VSKAKPKIPPAPPQEKEIRIPIKQKTAQNILVMNQMVAKKVAELNEAQANLQNHVLPICTERGLPDGARVVQVTEKAPWELIVMVPKGK
jgi:hypothetical protein